MSDTDVILSRDITRDQLVTELRALRPAFEARAVTHMTLFGSRARDDNRVDSDVDLMIEVAPDMKFSLLDLAGVVNIVQDRVGLGGNVFMRRSARPELVREAARDGVSIF